MSKRVLVGVGAAVVLLVLAGCSGGSSESSGEGDVSTTVAASVAAGEVDELRAEVADLEGRLAVSVNANDVLEAERDTATDDLESCEVSSDRVSVKLEVAERKIERLEKKVERLENPPVTTTTSAPVPPLEKPKGDGFYQVGVDIAPGLWRSTGTGDDCYWERLDENQKILDNHFGAAGGSVKIRSTDYEVHFQDCGKWEYQG